MILSCSSKSGAKPTTYVLSCADANSEVTHLHWSDWGDVTAFAEGTAKWNDCTPSCAAGTWKSKSVTVWAWGLQHNHYTRLSSNDPSLLSTISLKAYPG